MSGNILDYLVDVTGTQWVEDRGADKKTTKYRATPDNWKSCSHNADKLHLRSSFLDQAHFTDDEPKTQREYEWTEVPTAGEKWDGPALPPRNSSLGS